MGEAPVSVGTSACGATDAAAAAVGGPSSEAVHGTTGKAEELVAWGAALAHGTAGLAGAAAAPGVHGRTTTTAGGGVVNSAGATDVWGIDAVAAAVVIAARALAKVVRVASAVVVVSTRVVVGVVWAVAVVAEVPVILAGAEAPVLRLVRSAPSLLGEDAPNIAADVDVAADGGVLLCTGAATAAVLVGMAVLVAGAVVVAGTSAVLRLRPSGRRTDTCSRNRFDGEDVQEGPQSGVRIPCHSSMSSASSGPESGSNSGPLSWPGEDASPHGCCENRRPSLRGRGGCSSQRSATSVEGVLGT